MEPLTQETITGLSASLDGTDRLINDPQFRDAIPLVAPVLGSILHRLVEHQRQVVGLIVESHNRKVDAMPPRRRWRDPTTLPGTPMVAAPSPTNSIQRWRATSTWAAN